MVLEDIVKAGGFRRLIQPLPVKPLMYTLFFISVLVIGVSMGMASGSSVPESSYLQPLKNRAVFSSNRQDNNYELYAMNLYNRRDIIRLTHNSHDDMFPSVSPDAAEVVFVRYRSDNVTDIIRLGATGVETTIVQGKGQNFTSSQVWSPDKKEIVFASNEGDGTFTIYVMPSNGGARRRIAEGKYPAWSADGTKIAYIMGQGVKSMGNIHLFNLATEEVTQITQEGTFKFPSWDDNQRLAVTESNCLTIVDTVTLDKKQVTKPAKDNKPGNPKGCFAHWYPIFYGKKLLFTDAEVDTTFQLARVNVNGTGYEVLTNEGYNIGVSVARPK